MQIVEGAPEVASSWDSEPQHMQAQTPSSPCARLPGLLGSQQQVDGGQAASVTTNDTRRVLLTEDDKLLVRTETHRNCMLTMTKDKQDGIDVDGVVH